EIRDIAQAVIQNLLSLSVYFEVADEPASKQILKELQALCDKQDLRLEHQKLAPAAHSLSRELHHYAVTLIADTITAEALKQVSSALAKRKTNIDLVKRL